MTSPLLLSIFHLYGSDVAHKNENLYFIHSTSEMEWAWAANRLIEKVSTAFTDSASLVLVHTG